MCADSLFVAAGRKCTAPDGRTLRGRQGRVITCRSKKLDLFISAGVTDGNHVHGALVLRGNPDDAFRLSWVNTGKFEGGEYFKLLVIHRLATGIKVSGCDDVHDVQSVIARYSDDTGAFEHFHSHKIAKIRFWDARTLAALLSHDLSKDVSFRVRDWTPAITNCMVMPALVCAGMAKQAEVAVKDVLCEIGRPLVEQLLGSSEMLDRMVDQAYAAEIWVPKCRFDMDCTRATCVFGHTIHNAEARRALKMLESDLTAILQRLRVS